jgi:serine protease DegQ
MESIIKNGQVVRGWVGVEPQDINPELVAAFGLVKSTGTVIVDVLKGGPAEKAGIKKGDILISVGDKPVTDTVSMLNLVAQLSPGEKVKMTILRKTSEAKIDVTVGKRPRMKQPQHEE